LVADVVQQEVETNDVDVVLTFDRWGVSGHKNHASVHGAMTLLCMERRLPRGVRVFCLRTVNALRKYSVWLDVPASLATSPVAYVISGGADWWRIQRAMSAHRSQYVWFRKLYMLFSRYILINTYEQMNVQPSPHLN